MSTAAAAADPVGGVVGKKQLAELLGWSRSRLDRRIEGDPNFPVQQRGDQSGGWEFDAASVQTYLVGAPDDGEGGLAAPAPVAKIVHTGEETARQRLNAAQAQLAEDKLRERRGELVEAGELTMALAETVSRVSTGLNSLTDTLVRRLNLPESAGPIIRQEIDGLRRQLHTGLRDLLGDE